MGHAAALEELIRERAAREGPLPFAEVMRLALYHPVYGYYSTLRGFGAQGDFVTSPELHPLFGYLLGRQALDVWSALGRPAPLRIVEYGAGSGALAEGVLACIPDAEYAIEEPSAALRAVQRARLGERLVEHLSGPPHVVLANEVLDALPVHRVTLREGELRELRVDRDLQWVLTPASNGIERYFQRLRLLPAEGGIAEVCLELEPWIQQLAARLERGVALLLDYGAPAEALFSRPLGNLQTYYRHTLGTDPLVRLGEQDISVHVDFSTLTLAARDAGLEVLGVTSQKTLLRHLGLAALDVRSPTDRQALAALIDPHGLGRVGALFVARGLPKYHPVGLTGSRTWPAAESLPMLPPSADDEAFASLWREAFS